MEHIENKNTIKTFLNKSINIENSPKKEINIIFGNKSFNINEDYLIDKFNYTKPAIYYKENKELVFLKDELRAEYLYENIIDNIFKKDTLNSKMISKFIKEIYKVKKMTDVELINMINNLEFVETQLYDLHILNNPQKSGREKIIKDVINNYRCDILKLMLFFSNIKKNSNMLDFQKKFNVFIIDYPKLISFEYKIEEKIKMYLENNQKYTINDCYYREKKELLFIETTPNKEFFNNHKQRKIKIEPKYVSFIENIEEEFEKYITNEPKNKKKELLEELYKSFTHRGRLNEIKNYLNYLDEEEEDISELITSVYLNDYLKVFIKKGFYYINNENSEREYLNNIKKDDLLLDYINNKKTYLTKDDLKNYICNENNQYIEYRCKILILK